MIGIELRQKTGSCPVFGKRTKYLHQYQREGKVWHKMFGGIRVYLVGRKRRWRCKGCDKVFREEWPLVRKTMEAEADILRLLRKNSFRRIEEHYGISDEVSRGVLKRIRVDPGWADEWKERKLGNG